MGRNKRKSGANNRRPSTPASAHAAQQSAIASTSNPTAQELAADQKDVGEDENPSEVSFLTPSWKVRAMIQSIVSEGRDPQKAKEREALGRNLDIVPGRTIDRYFILDCFDWAQAQEKSSPYRSGMSETSEHLAPEGPPWQPSMDNISEIGIPERVYTSQHNRPFVPCS
jgi:hypothetical protein